MTAYCPNKLPGNAHTCLCTALAHHIGGHRCACGHTWGDPWHEMTYDQQRAFLGLKDVRGELAWQSAVRTMRGLASVIQEVWEEAVEAFSPVVKQSDYGLAQEEQS